MDTYIVRHVFTQWHRNGPSSRFSSGTGTGRNPNTGTVERGVGRRKKTSEEVESCNVVVVSLGSSNLGRNEGGKAWARYERLYRI